MTCVMRSRSSLSSTKRIFFFIHEAVCFDPPFAKTSPKKQQPAAKRTPDQKSHPLIYWWLLTIMSGRSSESALKKPAASRLLIRLLVHALYGTARRILHLFEGLIPLQGYGGGAGHRRLRRHAAGRFVAGEQLAENGAVIVFFLGARCINGKAEGSVFQLLVAYLLTCDLFQGIDPAIAYPIGKLLFL